MRHNPNATRLVVAGGRLYLVSSRRAGLLCHGRPEGTGTVISSTMFIEASRPALKQIIRSRRSSDTSTSIQVSPWDGSVRKRRPRPRSHATVRASVVPTGNAARKWPSILASVGLSNSLDGRASVGAEQTSSRVPRATGYMGHCSSLTARRMRRPCRSNAVVMTLDPRATARPQWRDGRRNQRTDPYSLPTDRSKFAPSCVSQVRVALISAPLGSASQIIRSNRSMSEGSSVAVLTGSGLAAQAVPVATKQPSNRANKVVRIVTVYPAGHQKGNDATRRWGFDSCAVGSPTDDVGDLLSWPYPRIGGLADPRQRN